MHSSEKWFWRRVVILLLVLGLEILSAGQARAFWPFNPVITPPPPPDAGFFVRSIRQMADDLVASLADPDPQQGDLAEGIVVCSFTDLAKLSRTSSMGRLLGEQLMTEFARKQFIVVDIRKSNSITIQEKRGEYGLSRVPEEIKPALSVGAMLTGTYQVAGDQVVINARIMDNRNAITLASASIVLPLRGVGERLLADAASLNGQKSEPIYKKRLDM